LQETSQQHIVKDAYVKSAHAGMFFWVPNTYLFVC